MLTNRRQNRAPPKAANKQTASRPQLSGYQKFLNRHCGEIDSTK